jgi:hypothetical protein
MQQYAARFDGRRARPVVYAAIATAGVACIQHRPVSVHMAAKARNKQAPTVPNAVRDARDNALLVSRCLELHGRARREKSEL